MSQFEPPSHNRSPEATRRRLLVGGLGLVLAATVPATTGCAPGDPRISSHGSLPRSTTTHSSTSATPAPTSASPAPAASPALASAEQSLADLAGGILTGPHRGGLGRSGKLLAAIREAHLQHAAALRSTSPTSRPLPTGPAAKAKPLSGATAKLSLGASISLLARSERSQATRLRRETVGADGFEALLRGSMAVSANSYAAALSATGRVPTDVRRSPHLPTAALSDVEALQAMVTQLHAMVYGYQLALGHLSTSSTAGKRAVTSLARRKALRDRLEQTLTSRSATIPAAAGAYVPSVRPNTPARSGALIRHMETALMPFCGLWLASATRPQDRTRALDALSATEVTARSWGAPVTVWPGWQN